MISRLGSLSVAVAFEFAAVLLFFFAHIYRRTYEQPLVPLIHTFVSFAVLCAAFGLLFVFVPWPQVLSYMAAVWLVSRVVEVLLYSFGVGRYAIYRQPAFARARRAVLAPLVGKIIGCAVLLGLAVHFVGF